MSNSVTLIYGDTLSGKTSFLESVIQHGLSRDKNFKARLYTAENWEALEPWERAGILEVCQIDIRQEPFDTIALATRGFIPADPLDPNSKWLKPEEQPTFPRIGAWLFEGMATFCDYMMGSSVKGGLAARSGRGERIGPAEETISFTDGGSKVGGNPRTHYNVTQRWIQSAVSRSKSLPGHVIWSSHEVVARDDRSQKPILGPELVGTAATSSAVRWFGNTIHALRVDTKIPPKGGSKEPLLKSEYRLYLRAHYSEEIPNIPYKAVMRVSPFIQEQADKLIPDYILNSSKAFSELMEIREKIEALIEGEIQRRIT